MRAKTTVWSVVLGGTTTALAGMGRPRLVYTFDRRSFCSGVLVKRLWKDTVYALRVDQ